MAFLFGFLRLSLLLHIVSPQVRPSVDRRNVEDSYSLQGWSILQIQLNAVTLGSKQTHTHKSQSLMIGESQSGPICRAIDAWSIARKSMNYLNWTIQISKRFQSPNIFSRSICLVQKNRCLSACVMQYGEMHQHGIQIQSHFNDSHYGNATAI